MKADWLLAIRSRRSTSPAAVSCELSDGLLGYAQFPGGPANSDGVVIRHSAFGTTGTVEPPFTLGRTATQELASCRPGAPKRFG